MEFSISMGLAGGIVLLVGAAVIGVAAQFVGEAHSGFEWIPTALGAAVGALVASEFVVAWQTFQPVYDGLALLPALGGGAVVGAIVAVVTRYTTGETYTGRTLTS